MEGRACHVEYLDIRGATVATFLNPNMRAKIESFHPDAAVICLGGNSIAGSGPPDLAMVAIDIHRLVARLVQYGVRSVAVCQVVRRLKWRNVTFEVGAARADQLNSYLKAFSEDMPFVFFWRHKRLWSSKMCIFRGDGCHFNGTLFEALRQETETQDTTFRRCIPLEKRIAIDLFLWRQQQSIER